MKIILIVFTIILLIIFYRNTKSRLSVAIIDIKTVEETQKDKISSTYDVVKSLNKQMKDTIGIIVNDAKTSKNIDSEIIVIDGQIKQATANLKTIETILLAPYDLEVTKKTKEIKPLLEKSLKTLNDSKTTRTQSKTKLKSIINSSISSLNSTVKQIYKENNFIFSNAVFSNKIKFSIEFININVDDIAKTKLYLTASSDTIKETKLSYSATETFWDIRQISNTTDYTISICDPNATQRTNLYLSYLSNDTKNTYAICNKLDPKYSYWKITSDPKEGYMYITNSGFYLSGPVINNNYATLNKTKNQFTINTYLLPTIPKSTPGLPTSVKELFKPDKKLILASDISPGVGCTTFIKNPNFLNYNNNPNFISNSITIGSKVKDTKTNTYTAVINIKYPVIKDANYQITLTLYTRNRLNTPIINNGTTLVSLFQGDGTFVMDDLKTPASTSMITVPSNDEKKYVYNIKWWRPSGDKFTLEFKFGLPTDTIMINDINITPL